MKKLSLVVMFSIVGILQAADSHYPYLSRHLPQESCVRQYCEENASWFFPNRRVTKACRTLEATFAFAAYELSNVQFITTNQSLIFEKRQLLYDAMIKKADFGIVTQRSLGIILDGTSISKSAREKEEDSIMASVVDIAGKLS